MTDGREKTAATGRRVSRRRTLRILGAAAGLPLLAPWSGWAEAVAGSARNPARNPAQNLDREGPLLDRGILYSGHSGRHLHHWQGVALGADAGITLNYPDPVAARAILAACLDEVARLEAVFSLTRPDSELVRLNRTGRLDIPSHDMVWLLGRSRHLARLSRGAFDITVQPLWRLYATHFARHPEDESGPPERAIAAVRRLVDYRRLAVSASGVSLGIEGMAVTLNGIAQGYITDRVTALLRRRGIRNVLVELGEARALGHHPEGRPWRIGLADPANPARIARTVTLIDRAVATSAGYGQRFERTGRYHHLLDPATGESARHYLSVSVIAATATTADGLATALHGVAPAHAARLVAAAGAAEAFLTLPDGRVMQLRG